MKKQLKLLFLILFCLPTMANITPYIVINKEYRVINQESSGTDQKSSTQGVTDVDGAESRIGAKGSKILENGMKASAVVELGTNSQRDNGAGERIRMRLAFVNLAGTFGSVTLGHHWNPNTLRMQALDPLNGTGAQLQGLESGDITGATSGNFGFRARYFNEGFTYTSPKYNGLGLSLTFDKNADDLAQDADAGTEKWTTAVVTFDKNLGSMMMNLHLTHAMGDIENGGSVTYDADPDQSFSTLGLKFSNDLLGFSAAYTKDNRSDLVVSLAAKEIERTHMLGTFHYNFTSMTTLAFNYGKTDFDDDENLGSSTDNKGGSQQSMSLGVIHKLAKNVKTRLVYRSQKIETNGNGTIAGTSKENSAGTYIAGLTVAF